MSIDSRLRQGLERSASGATTDLVDDLPDALARGRRRRRVLVAVRATTVAAVLAIVAVVGPRLVSSIRNEQPAAPTPTPSLGATDFSAIAGTYTVELSNTDATVAANHMAGTWTIQLGRDGAMQLSIPAGFTREGQTPAGNAFTLAASQFRTNLFYNDFCHSIGVYRWQLRGTRLTFTPLSEDCTVRRAIFASQPWDVQG
jgi:hypothetical protein